MSALKPCPFCGRGARVSWSRDQEVVNIRCESWSRECLGAGQNCWDEAAAIAAWNRRATPAEVATLRARVEMLEKVIRGFRAPAPRNARWIEVPECAYSALIAALEDRT